MKTRKIAAFFISMFFILFTIGCGSQSSSQEAASEPESVHTNFLYFTEGIHGEYDSSFGDLYIKEFGEGEVDKVSGDVRDYSFTYDDSSNKVYFISEDYGLYEYKLGKDKKKLADDVVSYQTGTGKIDMFYQNEEGDLYIIKEEEENEKIASNVYVYEMMEDDLYYLDSDGRLTVYNTESRVEEEIATSVSEFTLLNQQGDLAYLNDDYLLYFRDGKEGESTRISSDSIYSFGHVQFIDDELYYLEDDGDVANLYSSGVTEDSSTKKIASDVKEFIYIDNDFYFVNFDENLYRKKSGDDATTKLASDVYSFDVHDETVFYLDFDENLYKFDKEDKKEKIAPSVLDYTITPEGDVIYHNEAKELFVNDKKLVSDFKGYYYIFGNLVYSTNADKLFLMEDMKEAQVVDEDLSKYSYVLYYDQVVYYNMLDFADIEGVWKSEYDDTMYIELDEDGTMTMYPDGESMKLNTGTEGDLNTIYAYADDSTYVEITKVDDNSITLDTDYDVYHLVRSSKEEADSTLTAIQEEFDQEEIYYLFDGYINNFDRAINYGDFDSYLADYIYAFSDFYDEQRKFVNDMYNKDISEELVGYSIEDINQVDPNKYEVAILEKFVIYSEENDYEGSTSTMKNKYTVERIEDELLITDIVVNYE